MRAEGDRDFALPPEELFAKLSDAQFLAGCLQNVEVTRVEGDVAEWKMRPKLAFMAGSIDNTLTITERTPPTSMSTTIATKGIGATATVQTHLQFTPHEGGTRIHWQMEITQLTGLLKVVPRGLLQGTARKVVDDVWEMIEEGLKK